MGLLKYSLLDSVSRILDSVKLGWVPRICISSKFQGDMDAADPRTTL